MLQASRGRVLRSRARADERGVRLPSNSCLPHEIGAAPPTHPYSARLPPGPPLRCCGPNYPGGQDGKYGGGATVLYCTEYSVYWSNICLRIRSERTVWLSSLSISVGSLTLRSRSPGPRTVVTGRGARAHNTTHNSKQLQPIGMVHKPLLLCALAQRSPRLATCAPASVAIET